MQQPFVDGQAQASDEGAVAQQRFTDDAPGAKDEGAVAQHFTDDTAAAKDESLVTQQQFTDEAPAAKDESVLAQQQFTDDAAAVKEEPTVPQAFKDDAGGAAPEELAREPETFTDDKLARAEEPKSPPATMLPMTVTVEADPLFDFDQDSIRAESRKKLDDLIQQLNGVSYGEVITVGFADPIGSQLYNQSLSERRAASVKQYLASRGIPANRIKIEGRGETEEYATYKSCGGQGKQKLIACLQPDRRVEVTVTAGQQ